MGGTEPTACKNSPIFRAEHTPLIPPRSGWTHTHVNSSVHERLCEYQNKTKKKTPNYLLVPVVLGGRCTRRLLGVPDMSTGQSTGATGSRRCHWLVQLLHKPLLRRKHSASSVGWVWRGHLDPVHVRNVMGVQLRGSRVCLRTQLSLASPGPAGGGTRPITDRCVSRRGFVFFEGSLPMREHMSKISTSACSSRAEPVPACFQIHSNQQKVIWFERVWGRRRHQSKINKSALLEGLLSRIICNKNYIFKKRFY